MKRIVIIVVAFVVSIEAANAQTEDPQQLYNLAQSMLQSNDYVRATTAIKAAIALRPNVAEYHFFLATILRNQRKYDEAEVPMRVAAQLEPDMARLADWASVLDQAGRSAAAQVVYQTMETQMRGEIAKEPNAHAFFWLAYSLDGQSRIEEALAELAQAIKLDVTTSRLANYWYYIGVYFARLGELINAIAAATKSYQLDLTSSWVKEFADDLKAGKNASLVDPTKRISREMAKASGLIVSPYSEMPSPDALTPVSQASPTSTPVAAVATMITPGAAQPITTAKSTAASHFVTVNGEQVEVITNLPDLNVEGTYCDGPGFCTTLGSNNEGTYKPFSNVSARIRWWVSAQNGEAKYLARTELGRTILLVFEFLDEQSVVSGGTRIVQVRAGDHQQKLLEISDSQRFMVLAGQFKRNF